MKGKLISLALGTIFIGSNLMATDFSSLNLQDRFRDYKKSTFSVLEIDSPRGKYHFHLHDVDKDGFNDVVEIYEGNLSERSNHGTQPNPLIYAFDYNGDKSFKFDELLFDGGKDGLNGNEKKIPIEFMNNFWQIFNTSSLTIKDPCYFR
jgi:hypothetical protein